MNYSHFVGFDVSLILLTQKNCETILLRILWEESVSE